VEYRKDLQTVLLGGSVEDKVAAVCAGMRQTRGDVQRGAHLETV
jgi:hypothetical protein